jgi:aryl-alcohol dehydrogenase-like predicted oxidoreductase
MKYRRFGKTGITVSEIGFGAWGLGGDAYGPVDEKDAVAALELAFDKGVNFYDTADLYGTGKSEEILGKTFKKVRDRVIIATKGGTLPHAGFHMPQDFSEEHLRQALEKSLLRLRTDYVDLYQLHSPTLDDLEESGVIQTLEKLKAEGKIREFGVSVRSPDDGLVVIEKYGFPVVQVNFNMIDQRIQDNGLLDKAEEKNVGIIIRTPLVFGYLTGSLDWKKDFKGQDHRSNWPEEQLKRWSTAPDLFSFLYTDKTPVQAALRFCLDFDAVSTVIPGMLNKKHVTENLKANKLPPLTEIEHRKIKDIYDNNDFYDKKIKSVKQ